MYTHLIQCLKWYIADARGENKYRIKEVDIETSGSNTPSPQTGKLLCEWSVFAIINQI